MKPFGPSLSVAALLTLGLLNLTQIPAHAADYKALKEIPIGGAGNFDYLYADADGHRLYVSHGTKAVVIDTETDKVVGEIADTPGIHGIAVARDLGLGFTSNGREAKVSVFDLATLATKTKVDTGANPDFILFNPAQSEVYTFNGRGLSATVIDAKTTKVVATIDLGDKPESAVIDTKVNRIYDNLENKSLVAVIDSVAHKVLNTWPIAPGEKASGMAFDAEHHRLFIGCDNKLMIVMDSSNGKVVAQIPIGAGVDANAFDPGTQLAFASCGEDAVVTIAHEDSPDKYTVKQSLKTVTGARTMTVDTKTHKIYLAVGSGDTFRVLVYGM